MIKLLAIDTSSTACSLALLIGDKMVVHHEIAPMQQAKVILHSINKLLRFCNILLEQLDAVAFGCGPGSFTGVRIATSVAQGIGFGANLPLIPISSLAALAQGAFEELGWKKLLVATDARINEIYWGMFEIEHGLVQLKNRECVSPPSQIHFPSTQDWYGVGNGWEIYKNQLIYTPIEIDATQLPMASAVAHLAKIRYEKGECISPSEAQPIYLRDRIAQRGLF